MTGNRALALDPGSSFATERWRPVVGFEGRHEVSSEGRVRSTRFKNGSTDRPCQPRIRKLTLRANGYRQIAFGLGTRRGTKLFFYVHRLVLAAFKGPCPDGHEASHLNGTRDDNRPENLSWESPASNNARKVEHGTDPSGERGSRAKLTRPQVDGIRRRAANGETDAALAREHHVGSQTIRRVRLNKTWKRPT